MLMIDFTVEDCRVFGQNKSGLLNLGLWSLTSLDNLSGKSFEFQVDDVQLSELIKMMLDDEHENEEITSLFEDCDVECRPIP